MGRKKIKIERIDNPRQKQVSCISQACLIAHGSSYGRAKTRSKNSNFQPLFLNNSDTYFLRFAFSSANEDSSKRRWN